MEYKEYTIDDFFFKQKTNKCELTSILITVICAKRKKKREKSEIMQLCCHLALRSLSTADVEL